MLLLDDKSPMSTNLENDQEFIILKNTLSIGVRPSRKPKTKLWELILKVDNIISLWRVVFI